MWKNAVAAGGIRQWVLVNFAEYSCREAAIVHRSLLCSLLTSVNFFIIIASKHPFSLFLLDIELPFVSNPLQFYVMLLQTNVKSILCFSACTLLFCQAWLSFFVRLMLVSKTNINSRVVQPYLKYSPLRNFTGLCKRGGEDSLEVVNIWSITWMQLSSTINISEVTPNQTSRIITQNIRQFSRYLKLFCKI